jgi:hypothetical protein
MIRLGLQLTLNGGREAMVRLVLTAVAVALGVTLLLAAVAGIKAVNTQNGRYAWLSSGAAFGHGAGGTAGTGGKATAGAAMEPLWWLLSAEYFDGQQIGRVDVAATGSGSPVPPGVPRPPGPGQYYASPALTRLLRVAPAAELGRRFPAHQVGTIGNAALPAPGSLLIIVGHTPAELAHQLAATKVTSIETVAPSSCHGPDCSVGVGINGDGIDLILSVVAAGLLFPVLVFIGTASRLAAARREQRFAAMRLVGATPRQVSAISAVESSVAAVAGVAGGFGLFYLLRPAIAAIPFTGAPFFTSDLSLSLADTLAVALGVPVAAAVAALVALRRVQVSPLGVTRRETPPPPRIWRLAPLLAGIAELAVFATVGRPASASGQVQAFLPGFLLILAGLITAGPWLTMAGARVMARRARWPATLIAARRLSDNPRAGFRAVSGLILALFVTSVAVGIITTISDYRSGPTASAGIRNTVIDQFAGAKEGGGTVAPPSAATLARLWSVPGVRGVTLVHGDAATAMRFGGFEYFRTGLVACTQLARTPLLGRCPDGARSAAVPMLALEPGDDIQSSAVWPAASRSGGQLTEEELARAQVAAIVVSTGGTAAAARAQTVLDRLYPYLGSPATVAEMNQYQSSHQVVVMEQQLANVVILASLPIAGCALAVSIASGLTERQRPFSLLRLTGTPLGVLRRVVTLESVLPLLTAAVVSIGVGFLGAQLFLQAQLGYTLRPPGVAYYGIVLSGLAAALGIVAATLPLLRRITGPEVARND